MKSPKRSSAKGFTLLEVIIVIAIVALIAGMGLVIGYDTLSRSNVHEERDLVATLLASMRAKALANIDESGHILKIEADEYLVDGKAIARDTSVALSGDSEVVFEQLSGNAPACPCTITLTQDSKTQTISINEVGRIEW
jgi:prepilin-type N-terminal cleavage/methylation domain-containing protein